MAQTIDAFDAKLQKTTPHEVTVDANGEFVFQSTESDRFFKLPAATSLDDFEKHLAAHEEANKGQVSLAEQEEKLQQIFQNISNPNIPEVVDAEVVE